ncbi:MAG TPA: hypothetical protein VKM69_05255 [Natronoarchaeum rubrum]|nr:hypothetical protein [Natronoarchaeum rubrum]
MTGEKYGGSFTDERVSIVNQSVDVRLPDPIFALLDEVLIAGQQVGFLNGILCRERVATEQVFTVYYDRDLELLERNSVCRQPLTDEPIEIRGVRLEFRLCRCVILSVDGQPVFGDIGDFYPIV